MVQFIRNVVAALAIAALGIVWTAPPAGAQGAEISFGAQGHDTTQPVEITADEFRIDQADNSATFTGSVLVVQGEMRLSAGALRVEYGAPGTEMARRMTRLHATGGVTLVSGPEAAEAQEAVYDLTEGSVQMRGEVLITQGPGAISGDLLNVDLASGAGVMTGRVRTVFQPGGSGGQ
jgi:lipopolysaccharide export system protein LptA